jgi:hypothetical protein
MSKNDDKKLGKHIVFEDDTEKKILKDYITGIYDYKELANNHGVSEYRVGKVVRELGGYFHTKRKNGIRGIMFGND